MIELKNVSKYYNSAGVVSVGLRNVDLKLYKNEIVAIVGDSGSGKSTLLNVICNVDTYEDGEMYFNGTETSHFNQNDMDLFRKEHVGFIYQNYNIIESYTVLENVMLPLILKGSTKNEAKKRALELLEEVGLSHRVYNKGAKLSGGEKQRCVIARALASDCSILACDEPTGNLDTKTSIEIIDLIKKVSKDKLVLIVTHSYEEVKDIATRKITVSDGMIIEDQVIKTVEEEDKVEVKEEIEPIKKRNLFKVSLNNIKCTPRKTIFTFFVFFFISLVAFYLYLTCMSASEKSVYNPDKVFGNYEYNRLIAFNFDHSQLNDGYKNVNGVYFENAFYEDTPFKFELVKDKEKTTFEAIYTRYTKMTYDLVLGEELTDSNQFFIILPQEKLNQFSLILTNFVGGGMNIGNKTLTFVGYGSSQYVSKPTIISTENLEKEVAGLAYQTLIDFEVVYDKTEINERITWVAQKSEIDAPKLYVSPNLQKYIESGQLEFVYKLNGLYDIVNFQDIEVVYDTHTYNLIKLLVPNDAEYDFGGIYEVSVYADRPNVMCEELEAYGYTVIRPSIYHSRVDQNSVLFIIYVAASTLIIFALAFISNAILQRVYNTKIKQYTVFRSLGVVKKEMNLIVLLEFLLIATTAIILAFIAMYALYFIFKFEFLNVIIFNNAIVTLIYFAVMFMFIMYIVSRFNKRLYQYSVQSTFKAEVSN